MGEAVNFEYLGAEPRGRAFTSIMKWCVMKNEEKIPAYLIENMDVLKMLRLLA